MISSLASMNSRFLSRIFSISGLVSISRRILSTVSKARFIVMIYWRCVLLKRGDVRIVLYWSRGLTIMGYFFSVSGDWVLVCSRRNQSCLLFRILHPFSTAWRIWNIVYSSLARANCWCSSSIRRALCAVGVQYFFVFSARRISNSLGCSRRSFSNMSPNDSLINI